MLDQAKNYKFTKGTKNKEIKKMIDYYDMAKREILIEAVQEFRTEALALLEYDKTETHKLSTQERDIAISKLKYDFSGLRQIEPKKPEDRSALRFLVAEAKVRICYSKNYFDSLYIQNWIKIYEQVKKIVLKIID